MGGGTQDVVSLIPFSGISTCVESSQFLNHSAEQRELKEAVLLICLRANTRHSEACLCVCILDGIVI